MRKTQELYYLIGEGLLGSRIKEILLKNKKTVISQDKNLPKLSKGELDTINPNIVKKIFILYFAGPKYEKDLQNKSAENIYRNIDNYLSQFYNNSKYEIIYANSSSILPEYKEAEINNTYKKYNSYFLATSKLASNFYNLFIPYIYPSYPQDENSLYTKIKKNRYYIKEEDQKKIIPIMSLEKFGYETFQKILKIKRKENIQKNDIGKNIGLYRNNINLPLGIFRTLILKGTI